MAKKRKKQKRRSGEQYVAYAYSPAPVSQSWRMAPQQNGDPVAAVFSPIKPAGATKTNWLALGGLAVLGLGLTIAFTPSFSPPRA